MAGNLRLRFRKTGPTGEEQSSIFKYRRTRSMKNLQQFSQMSVNPVLLTCKFEAPLVLRKKSEAVGALGGIGKPLLKEFKNGPLTTNRNL